jgi:predicted glycoside hydrolase/deacetylase ChbG (UPF0249 family)
MEQRGLLFVNADDWGRDAKTTSRILDCVVPGAVSSVSGMVFMEDSERAAALARLRGIEVGLHLNLTTPFTAKAVPPNLMTRQLALSRYLRRGRMATVAMHPGLAKSFEYVVTAQMDEFRRLYGSQPERIDGHHHSHLCANVLFQRLLPPGTLVRRNFSFQAGERNVMNLVYRHFVDRVLARRHQLADFFFSLAPLEPASRLKRIFSMASQFVVEVETHPAKQDEYRFLHSGEIFRWIGDAAIEPPSIFIARRRGGATVGR